jgi:hypothetical protein
MSIYFLGKQTLFLLFIPQSSAGFLTPRSPLSYFVFRFVFVFFGSDG